MNRIARIALIVLGCSVSAACTHVAAVTLPPPGKTASLDFANDRVTLSHGVAFAIQCLSCKVGESFSDDSTVASILPTTEELANTAAASTVNTTNSPRFVLVGEAPGVTHVRIAVLDAEDIDLEVTVLDD